MPITDGTPLYAADLAAVVAEEVAASPTVAAAAADAVDAALAASDIIVSQELILPDSLTIAFAYDTGELAYGQYRDGTTYPPTVSGDVDMLDDGFRGWRMAAIYADGEIAWGVRDDGTWYPSGAESSGSSSTSADPLDTAPVLMLGHSIIANWWDSTADLGTRLGRGVSIRAIGGRGSDDIAAFYGAIPAQLTLTGNAIPATGSVAATASPANFLKLPNDGTYTLDGQLAGVKVRVTCTTASGVATYSVTQLSPGTAVPCAAGTPFVADRDERCLLIAGMMRNDLGSLTTDQSIANQRAIIESTTYPRLALVLGVLPDSSQTIGSGGRATYDAARAAQRAAFGVQWVDWLAWLQSSAAAAAGGITFTSQDNTDITNGITPTSFRADSIHLNNAGEVATNALIALHYQSRGLL